VAGQDRRSHRVVACDDHGRGGCGRDIAKVTVNADGHVIVVGSVIPESGDPAGILTTRVPGIGAGNRLGSVIDLTDPAGRTPPQLRTDLLAARRLAHEAGEPFPDGVPFEEAVAAEIANLDRLTRGWDPRSTTSGTGRRQFRCLYQHAGQRGRHRQATVTQAQLDAAYHLAASTGRRRITLDDLRRAPG
jgi:hypothetical protein